MDILQIALFGGIRVTHNNWLTELIITREIQALLAYLLLQPHWAHSREVLADIFWGEHIQERARGSLNTPFWLLKKVLELEGIPAGTYLKNNHPGEEGFNTESQYWLDVEIFEQEIIRILSYPFQSVEETHIADLEKVLGLYKGELMEGFMRIECYAPQQFLSVYSLPASQYQLALIYLSLPVTG